MTSKDMVSALLESFTPDELQRYAERIVAEQEKEKRIEAEKKAEQEKKKKAVAAARQKVVDAMKEYSKAMYGTEPDIKLMDSFNSDLAEIEKRFTDVDKMIGVDDDATLRKFLRGLMA